MKCAITGQNIAETFLNKPLGTCIKVNGKKHWVSSDAQRGKTKEQLVQEIKGK